jgi:diadenosine tetraphosphate (Ap4A) HIT family hydrolase
MTRAQTIASIGELARLMEQFADDQDELANLEARMRIRLDHLHAHVIAGRPDLTRPNLRVAT